MAFALVLVGRTARAEGADQNAEASDEKTKESDEKAEGSGNETEGPGEKARDQKKGLLGVDLEFVVPVGNMADGTGPQLGPLLKVGGRVSPAVEISARMGYLAAFNKSQTASGTAPGLFGGPVTVTLEQSITNIPIWLGARFFYPNETVGFYVAGDLAFNILMLNASATAASGGRQASNSSSDTLTRAGFNVGLGCVASRKVPIDIAVHFSYFNLLFTDNGERALLGVGFSVGYSLFF